MDIISESPSPRKSGIYQILNIKTNECYIGCSDCIRQRISQHFGRLRRNKHHAKRLQASFNLHGIDAFRVSVLQFSEYYDLQRLELAWMIKLRPALNTAVPDFASSEANPSELPHVKQMDAQTDTEFGYRKCRYCDRERRLDIPLCGVCRQKKIREMERAGYLQSVPADPPEPEILERLASMQPRDW